MAEPNWENRTLFHADNIDVLRQMNSQTVDLIATDPPFNKSKDFHATPVSLARGARFQDRWTWDDIHEEWKDTIDNDLKPLAEAIESARYAHSEGMAAYACFMSVRLMEMHRLLKPTGSIFLHCDPTASHYLKACMDAIFGSRNFLADIVWPRYAPHSLAASGIDTISDHILLFARDASRYTGKLVSRQLTRKERRKRFPKLERATQRYFQTVALEQSSNRSSTGETRIIQGKVCRTTLGWRWSQQTFDKRLAANPNIIYWTKNGRPRYKIYLDEYQGRPVGNIWTDIPYLASGDLERTGYPTQKPIALYERIINTSTNPGEVVLDPFAGCATTCIAAERLGRQWIGIDIWESAHQVVLDRFTKQGYSVNGEVRQAGRVFTFGNVIYTKELPVRTDEGRTAGEKLLPIWVRPKERWQTLTNKQIKANLVALQMNPGTRLVICVGCGRELEQEFMQLDHIQPRSEGGVNFIDNRILLCGPCNRKKSDKRTLKGLIADNKRVGWMQSIERSNYALSNVNYGVRKLIVEASNPL